MLLDLLDRRRSDFEDVEEMLDYLARRYGKANLP